MQEELKKAMESLTPEQREALLASMQNQDFRTPEENAAIMQSAKDFNLLEKAEEATKANFRKLFTIEPNAVFFALETSDSEQKARFVAGMPDGTPKEIDARAFIEQLLGGGNFTGVVATFGMETPTEQDEADILRDMVEFFDVSLQDIGKKAFVFFQDNFYFVDIFSQQTPATAMQFINIEKLLAYLENRKEYLENKRDKLKIQLDRVEASLAEIAAKAGETA